MLPKCLLYQVGIVLVVTGLAFTPGATMAQAVPEDAEGDNDAPTATSVMVEETITLDMAERVYTTAPKQSIQETTKAVPGEADVTQDDTSKQHMFLPLIWGNGELNATVEAAEATEGWDTVEFENFEGIWPDYGWSTYDCNGSGNGTYYWDDESWIFKDGSWSAWPAGSTRNPHTSFYPNNACAWMIYGPFSLQSAQTGSLSFYLWSQTEFFRDWIGWYVSCDLVNWSGVSISGETNGWDRKHLSLDSCLGDATVWIGFQFTSDSFFVDDGPFIDKVVIQRYQYP